MTTALKLRAAVLLYENSPDPIADCWDTESGEYEEGAQAFPSDWAHHYADYQQALRRDEMRALVGLPPLLQGADWRQNLDEPEPACRPALEQETRR